MTPAEHYAEAERVIAWTNLNGPNMSADQQRNSFLCAQIHATLATVDAMTAAEANE